MTDIHLEANTDLDICCFGWIKYSFSHACFISQ